MCIRLYCSNNLIYRERTVENVKLSRSTAAHCYRDVQLLIRNGVTGRFPTVGAETHTDTHTHTQTLTHTHTHSNILEHTGEHTRTSQDRRRKTKATPTEETFRSDSYRAMDNSHLALLENTKRNNLSFTTTTTPHEMLVVFHAIQLGNT